MANEIKQIATALVKAQSEMGNAIKDSSNPFFKSKYADLNSVREACIPILNKHGIVALQPTVHIDGRNFVKTILLHESGESIEGLTEIVFSKPNNAQEQGSGITYARRYGLQSLVNIGADDDDGNLATHGKSKPNENLQQPQQTPAPTNDNLTWLNKYSDKAKTTITLEFKKVAEALKSEKYTMADVRKKYKVSKETEQELNDYIQ